jgi:hypothetical protein
VCGAFRNGIDPATDRVKHTKVVGLKADVGVLSLSPPDPAWEDVYYAKAA